MQRAAQANAQVIVFPEQFLTGPLNGNVELIDEKGKYVRLLRNLARRYALDVVAGSIIERDAQGLHNTAHYIDATGSLLASYHKINLWQPERKGLLPGEQPVVFETAYGKVGLAICWDLVAPALWRTMASKGAEFVFCPAYWCAQLFGNEVKHDRYAEIKHVDALCIARAFENELFLAYCNAAGSHYQDTETFPKNLIGHSQITAPFKGAMQRLNHNSEELLLQEVDTDILRAAEDLYGIRAQFS